MRKASEASTDNSRDYRCPGGRRIIANHPGRIGGENEARTDHPMGNRGHNRYLDLPDRDSGS